MLDDEMIDTYKNAVKFIESVNPSIKTNEQRIQYLNNLQVDKGITSRQQQEYGEYIYAIEEEDDSVDIEFEL